MPGGPWRPSPDQGSGPDLRDPSPALLLSSQPTNLKLSCHFLANDGFRENLSRRKTRAARTGTPRHRPSQSRGEGLGRQGRYCGKIPKSEPNRVLRVMNMGLRDSSQLYASRQKLTLKGERKALDDDTPLKDAGVNDGGELFVKDLGAQISWRTVFVVEYVSSNHLGARWKTTF